MDTRVAFRWLGRAVLAGVLAGMYAPVVMVFVYSFNESRLGSVWTGFSTHWYGELFRESRLWAGLRTSLLIGLLASTLSVILGTLTALGLRRWRRRPRQFARGLLGLPLVVPDIILALALALFFHAVAVQLREHGITVQKGFWTVVLAHTAFGVAYAFVAVSAAVEDLDDTLFAAALDAGATPWQAFRLVTVPILAPSLVVAWLLVFALSFDDFLITFFTKGTGGDTLPILIYSQMRFGVRPATNALFVVLFLATLAAAGLAALVGRRRALVR